MGVLKALHALVETTGSVKVGLSFGLINSPFLFSEGLVQVNCGPLTFFVGAVFEPANGFFYLVNKCLAAGW